MELLPVIVSTKLVGWSNSFQERLFRIEGFKPIQAQLFQETIPIWFNVNYTHVNNCAVSLSYLNNFLEV